MGMLDEEISNAAHRAREQAVKDRYDWGKHMFQKFPAVMDVRFGAFNSKGLLGGSQTQALDTSEKTVSNQSRDTAP